LSLPEFWRECLLSIRRGPKADDLLFTHRDITLNELNVRAQRNAPLDSSGRPITRG
jgi:hypothetical protein